MNKYLRHFEPDCTKTKVTHNGIKTTTMNKYLHHSESCGEGLYGDVMFFVQKQVPNHIITTTK